MESRLSGQQLEQIVGEVERLANRQQTELSRTEVEQILVELNLPPELLDEATIQVHRRQALIRQQQRNRNIALGIIATIVAITLGTGLWFQQRSQSLAKVAASQATISLASSGNNIRSAQRGDEVIYRVRLSDAPVGDKLDLTCNWIDPTGKIDRTNRYATKNITTPIWNTQCREAISATAPQGKWRVEMRLGDRILQSTDFEVK